MAKQTEVLFVSISREQTDRQTDREKHRERKRERQRQRERTKSGKCNDQLEQRMRGREREVRYIFFDIQSTSNWAFLLQPRAASLIIIMIIVFELCYCNIQTRTRVFARMRERENEGERGREYVHTWQYLEQSPEQEQQQHRISTSIDASSQGLSGVHGLFFFHLRIFKDFLWSRVFAHPAGHLAWSAVRAERERERACKAFSSLSKILTRKNEASRTSADGN